MSKVKHASFTLTRDYKAAPQRVFAAWTTLEAKQHWFGCDPSWVVEEKALDFRVGGIERWRVGPAGGARSSNETIYYDIVPNSRIIYSCAMRIDDVPISTSLMTVTFAAQGPGTKLIFTEQAVFVDGYDDVEGRIHGTNVALDRLGEYAALAPA
jgi:uncharacterized protein YndB with AHSA1/START domain